jgi:coproporphyrinogen III oxidase
MAEQKSEQPSSGEKKSCCKCKGGKKVKPSELPLYGNPYPPKDIILNDEPNAIEDGLRSVREAISPIFVQVQDASQRGRQFLDTGVSHARTTYDRISDDGNSVEKAVAITAGGLVGLLLSARKGFFKKLIYTSGGVGVMVAACYPKQTTEFVELTSFIARKKGPELVKEFTGYDITPYVGIPTNKQQAIAPKPAADQSNPADKDLYANRSSK